MSRFLVVYLGELDGRGRFARASWEDVIELLRPATTHLLLHTPMSAAGVAATLGLGVSIEDTTTPDDLYLALTVRLRGAERWLNLARANFDPETGITHITFCDDEGWLAHFQSDDGPLFALFETEAVGRHVSLTQGLRAESKHHDSWRRFAAEVDDLTDGESWTPCSTRCAKRVA